MDQNHKHCVDLTPARGTSQSTLSGEARPMGLLYTLLRHGRGLSHEEAHRQSFESIHSQTPQGRNLKGQPPKAA